MEPWDGPASIAFTDGKQIGAVLDRNGLRPSRYYVTKDDLVIMASRSRRARHRRRRASLRKGRLQPGRMFLVDTEQGRIVADEEIKRKIADEQPVSRVARRAPDPARRPAASRRSCPQPDHDTLLQRQLAFGYTFEDLRILHGADGARRRRSRRLDGQRHAARGALEQAAAALQLFQAALRAGHQSADRLHPRRDHHLGRDAPSARKATC